jgi:hypothetical protein
MPAKPATMDGTADPKWLDQRGRGAIDDPRISHLAPLA